VRRNAGGGADAARLLEQILSTSDQSLKKLGSLETCADYLEDFEVGATAGGALMTKDTPIEVSPDPIR
jgi:hypothetical protein